MGRRRVAVLISGRGSNLQALADAAARPATPFEIVLAASDRPGASGLARAEEVGVPTALVDRRTFPDRAAHEAALERALQEAGAELVCLAGYMRVLSAGFVARWRDRLLNIHPSLLPAFRGLDTHARALAAGVQVHGCTVHLVRAELDAGPILVQGVVPVLPGDTAEALAARVLEVEHRCYPLALALLASGRVEVEGERLSARGAGPAERLLLHPLLRA